MRNRAAPTTAAASVTRESAGAEHRGERVFGKVAEPHPDGTGARGQDIELFDATVRLPKVPSGASEAPALGSRRSRRTRAVAPAWRSMPLPLMLAGALSAGFGAAVAVWVSAEPDSVPASHPSVSLPVLATRAPSPAPEATSDTSPSPAASTARTTPSTPPAPGPSDSSSETPSPSATPPTSSPSTAAASSPATAPTPTPSSSHRHRPSHPDRDEEERHEGKRDGIARGSTGPEVTDLQRRLQELKLYVGPADGVFGEAVETALRRYQASRYIPQEDGVYGPLTRAVLRAETD
ncbi:peptidoglycan-binding domain-containing protein [Streptomyces cinereoruber]|uniref:peptidoglycan-binding domain-containing protein n=1 Tax=Streptomyces cinereoruber TaxID=67260 RepID=UPI00363204A9